MQLIWYRYICICDQKYTQSDFPFSFEFSKKGTYSDISVENDTFLWISQKSHKVINIIFAKTEVLGEWITNISKWIRI